MVAAVVGFALLLGVSVSARLAKVEEAGRAAADENSRVLLRAVRRPALVNYYPSPSIL